MWDENGGGQISRRSNDQTAVIDYRANDFIVARVQGGFEQEFGTSIAFGWGLVSFQCPVELLKDVAV